MAFAESRARRAISRASTVAIVVILLVVAIGSVYYISTTGPSPSSSTTASSSSASSTTSTSSTLSSYSGPPTIKIGMTMPLSGSLATDGVLSLDGLKLWAQNVNASGGIYVKSLNHRLPVQLIYYDDTSTASVVATDYQQLVTQGVNFLVAPYSSGLTLAAAPIAETNHILLMSHGGASDSIWSHGYHYVVGVLSPGSQYMIPVLQMLQNRNSSAPLKVALFFGNDAFSISVRQGALAYINSTSGKFSVVYNQLYDEPGTSHTAELTQIQSYNPDVILGGAHFADGETIMKNIQSLGLHFNMVSLLVAPDDPHFPSDLGALANSVVAPSQWEPNLDFSHFTPYYGNISSSQFFSQFQSTFGITPNYEAAEAYNTGLVLQKAITDSGSLNSTTVRSQMSGENFWTFYGNFQIGPTGIQAGHTMVVMQWQTGVKQTIWPKAVATSPFVYPAP
ncbi:MAG: amino acid ABC transporter substrate-binding protein [Nitrososphaerales archaeon]|nr:amino acid ABC transporter substrate-binding protein [Nitrososphaerales archaeon]